MAWPMAVDVDHDWSTAPPGFGQLIPLMHSKAHLFGLVVVCHIKDLSFWMRLLSQIRIHLLLLILFGKFDRMIDVWQTNMNAISLQGS